MQPISLQERKLRRWIVSLATAALVLGCTSAPAEEKFDSRAIDLLMPFAKLENTVQGKQALDRNQSLTLEIRQGLADQPLLLSFEQQREQALRDATITAGNARQLADGLGSRLGNLYQAAAYFVSSDDGKHYSFNNIASLGTLFAAANKSEYQASSTAKYFFGKGSFDGGAPDPKAIDLLAKNNGKPNVYGIAYPLTSGADSNGDPRPFLTEIKRIRFDGDDYFAVPTNNYAFLAGSISDSPAFPSGHTTYGYTEGLLLALLVPARFQEMMTRSAEYGNGRIILGAHYAMDIIGGRTLALYEVAQLLGTSSDKPNAGEPATLDFRAMLKQARNDLTSFLEANCKNKVEVCAQQDESRFASKARNEAFYEATQTYGLPTVYPDRIGVREDVAKQAHEAGNLLVAAFPYLSIDQADDILTRTEGPGGGFLDDGSPLGVYSRIDLYRAAGVAMTLRPKASSAGSPAASGASQKQ